MGFFEKGVWPFESVAYELCSNEYGRSGTFENRLDWPVNPCAVLS